MLRTLFAVSLIVALCSQSLRAQAPSRPNIVLLISDQHFADVMGCAGYEHVKTPALDRLASTGVRFPNTYCTYPVCMPSRASLMTGRWPHELKAAQGAGAGESDNDDGPSKKGSGTEKAHSNPPGKSLGTLMKEAGYETAYFGKWHVNGVSSDASNAWHGFDTLVDGHRDEATASKAVEFLKAKHDKPFFLVVSFMNPHDICEWARMRSGIKDKMGNGLVALEPPLADCPPLPFNFRVPADEPEVVGLRRLSQPTRAHPTVNWGETEWRQYRWAYARLIEKMDEQVGRVMTALDASGRRDQTLVVYTSDHGDGNGTHQWNQKMVLYEEAVRIPMIVSWPGQTPAGKVETGRLVSMGLDILPTLCDYAGTGVPQELTGRSVRPWAERAATPPADAPGFVVSEVTYTNLRPDEKLVQGLLVRTANYAYINYSAGEKAEQLFDLRSDPGQMTNLVAHPDHQAVLQQHRELMREWIQRTKSPFPLARVP